ncbi:NAD-dependent deacylase [Hydrogenophaga crassostreae]|uniref:NAD-dependent protein deacylase n=1 Tax=Hydrogenophaga crassostreae TaxID=1763535 RepID=A0A167I417_9BURK|nr:NAD-dependent deacylase [Hydrogenophaga crassostreae]AOW13288.1 NAD-dependent deacylase [Hydrogenophaga crassostreae]OAD42110.1 NAD-dependent deacylase [Hydrogenophaga crassostreae]
MTAGRDSVRAWAAEARHIAVLTGAGVSAESGVPTFRDALTGLWAQFDPQELATESAYRAHPERVWDWYAHRRTMLAKALPNAGHLALARFGQTHPDRLTLVTQNVDGLHQGAGQPETIALHGSLMEDRWLDAPRACCNSQPPQEGRPPVCATCGNLRRPGVVWFGENLPPAALAAAEAGVARCDVMLVVGTSGQVYPAAGLAFAAHQQGARVVVINPETTELDRIADVCLREPSAICLPFLLESS